MVANAIAVVVEMLMLMLVNETNECICLQARPLRPMPTQTPPLSHHREPPAVKAHLHHHRNGMRMSCI